MSEPLQFDEALASRLKEDLVCQAIKSLEEMGGDCLMSGEDSGLQSIWEEVCVQVQHEESFFWDTYVEVIEDFLTALVEGLSQKERLALWLSADAGCDWIADNEDDETDGAAPGVYVGDIVAELKSDLLSKAADFENERIERYFRQQDGDDDWGEDEDEDEYEDEDAGEETEGDESKPADANANAAELNAIFDQVLAEVFEGRESVSGSRPSIDLEVGRNALDEQGKAELDVAVQGLRKIFGVRSMASEAPPEVAKLDADGQSTAPDAPARREDGNE